MATCFLLILLASWLKSASIVTGWCILFKYIFLNLVFCFLWIFSPCLETDYFKARTLSKIEVPSMFQRWTKTLLCVISSQTVVHKPPEGSWNLPSSWQKISVFCNDSSLESIIVFFIVTVIVIKFIINVITKLNWQ